MSSNISKRDLYIYIIDFIIWITLLNKVYIVFNSILSSLLLL